jgi:hypothetical protein
MFVLSFGFFWDAEHFCNLCVSALRIYNNGSRFTDADGSRTSEEPEKRAFLQIVRD